MNEGDYNHAKKQIYDLCRLLGEQNYIEIKVRCIFCESYAMLLKEKGLHYYCLACGEEGDLEHLEEAYHDKMREIMEKPSNKVI